MQKEIAVISLKKLNPNTGGIGGTQAVVLWLLEALKSDYKIDFYSPDEPLQLRKLNGLYGTNLSEGDFRQVRIQYSRLPKYLFLLERSLVLRRLRNVFRRTHYAAIISADKEIDLGRVALQYFHHPVIDIYLKDDRRADIAHWVYRRLCATVSGASWAGLRRNLSLTNSFYSARLLWERYGINARVVYPPVVTPAREVRPQKERENIFVMVSRLSPEKRVEDAVEILRQVHDSVSSVRLIVIGPDDGSAYAHSLKRLFARYSWVSYLGRRNKEEIRDVLDTARYLINTRQDEPFGMVVAEALCSGVIPFVFNGGGQTEIVSDTRLTFVSSEDAVKKIKAVIGNETWQTELAQALLEKCEAFSSSAFSGTIRRIMKETV